jgi:hypothetical protein
VARLPDGAGQLIIDNCLAEWLGRPPSRVEGGMFELAKKLYNLAYGMD